jgi:hypothetical protein
MITAKLDPIARDLRVALDDWTGPRARAEALAERAGAILAETDARNAAALGRLPDFDTFVDGVKTEQLDRVRADGVIVRVYDAMPLVLMQIGTLLWIIRRTVPVFIESTIICSRTGSRSRSCARAGRCRRCRAASTSLFSFPARPMRGA